VRGEKLQVHFSLAGTFALFALSETEFLMEDALRHVFFSTDGDNVSFTRDCWRARGKTSFVRTREDAMAISRSSNPAATS
jgi:hypothetical protein